jgi:glycosyltransferase involved in cell wall biosynthesis
VRVAHLNLSRGYRGGERQTELLIRGLAGFDVTQCLVCRRDSPLIERLTDIDIEIRPVAGGLMSALGSTRGVDLVHSHEGRGVYVAWARSLLSGTPYVLTRRVNNRLDNNWITHSAYRRAACVAGVAARVAEIVCEFDPKVSTAVVYSSNSALKVDSAVASEIRNAYRGKWIVGNVGALDNRQKGQEYIIKVARELQDSHPHIQFMLVGGGDDEAMLRDLAAGLRNLDFVGFVNNVGDYLAAFDLFVLPSNKEGVGSILMDAMSVGLPIVASCVGGVPEIIIDSENGILIEAGHTDQLKAAIVCLHDDPEMARRIGNNGRSRGLNFSADIMTGKYLEIYQNALARTIHELPR